MSAHEHGDGIITTGAVLGATAGAVGMFFLGIQAGNGDIQREQNIQQAEHRLLAPLSPEAQKFILDQSKLTSPDAAVTAAKSVTDTNIYPLVKTYQNLEKERQDADSQKNADQSLCIPLSIMGFVGGTIVGVVLGSVADGIIHRG